MTPKQLRNFNAKIDKSGGPDACWNWIACKTRGGYGQFNLNAKNVGAHRIAYYLSNGAIPKGFGVCHRCDNPSCCNPSHLFLGLQADNMADMAGKGRSARLKGSKHGRSKLNEEQVSQIRRLYALGSATKKECAQAFCISETQARDIINRKRWAHL